MVLRSNPAARAAPPAGGIHPALQSFGDECAAVALRLAAYMGLLALIVMGAVRMFDSLDFDIGADPVAPAEWAAVSRPHPSFAISQFDSSGKTASYEVFRHAGGGRKETMRWAAAGERPVAELELYRPGREAAASRPVAADLAARMDPDGAREMVGEGIVDTKFGPVALIGLAGQAGDRCLGFWKRLDGANLQISGWSCQGDSLPARRAAIACTLNRLTLLTSGNDPRLQEAFAQAELRRGSCISGAALSASAADWVTGAQNPVLRGSL